MVVELDERADYDEDRCIGIGLLNGQVVVVVDTEPDKEKIRIISLRKHCLMNADAMNNTNTSKTDWNRIDAMSDEDIDIAILKSIRTT